MCPLSTVFVDTDFVCVFGSDLSKLKEALFGLSFIFTPRRGKKETGLTKLLCGLKLPKVPFHYVVCGGVSLSLSSRAFFIAFGG